MLWRRPWLVVNHVSGVDGPVGASANGPGPTAPAPAGSGRLGLAGALAGAPAEVVDFVLPLWAAAHLRLGAVAVGALIAVEALASVAGRFWAGPLADRFERRRVAAAGALISAAAFAGYAGSTSWWQAAVSAGVGGAGGALFWVALRALVAQTATDRRWAYARLLAAEGQGALVGYLLVFSLLGQERFEAVFLCGAAAFAVAAVVVARGGSAVTASAPGADSPGASAAVDAGAAEAAAAAATSSPHRRRSPMLVTAGTTAAAEAAIWLLLVLELTRQGLEPQAVAWVFAPGFVLFVLLPEPLQRLTARVAPVTLLRAGSLASAALAVTMAVSPRPAAIGAVWAGLAVCLAALIPAEQTLVAGDGDDGLGRAMAGYENARLVGAGAGALLAGPVLQLAGWLPACLFAGGLALAGAALAGPAVRALGMHTWSRPPGTVPTDCRTRVQAGEMVSPRGGSGADKARRERTGWFVHSGIFIVGQAIFLALGHSWLYLRLARGGVPVGEHHFLITVGRAWVVIYVIDTLISWSYTFFPRDATNRARP